MKDLLEIAIEAALDSGKAIMQIYESDDFGVDMKGDNSPLTKADIASHNMIMSYLERTGIPVLSEEGKDIPFEDRKGWKQLWIVDPIDGTKEFIKRNGEFTVNIALIQDQVPVLGVVFTPALNELYFATQEIGSFKVNTSDTGVLEELFHEANRLPISTSRRIYTVVASRSHMSEETEDFIKELQIKHGEVATISKGSSLKLCMVAEGLADFYPRFAPTMEWDTAAGQAICIHAGFDVVDWETQSTMKYNREVLLNNWFLVR
jgi:3'(2'), 5'-bisphosphate nucleotidase